MKELTFIQPIIEAYKLGLFENCDLPIRALNALDSLSYFDGVYNHKEVVRRTLK